MNNRWIAHVKQYQLKNNCSYKDAMKNSKSTYKQSGSYSGSGAIISLPANQDVDPMPPQNLTQAKKNKLIKKYMKEIREYDILIKNNPNDPYTTQWKLHKSDREYQVGVLLNPDYADQNRPLSLQWN